MPKQLQALGKAFPELEHSAHDDSPRPSPAWQLPTMSFRPMSLTPYSPISSTRPRTSGATPVKMDPEIHSPIPKRPMSSQSRKRLSKILDIDKSNPDTARPRLEEQRTCHGEPELRVVEESPLRRKIDGKVLSFTPRSVSSAACSSMREGFEITNENDVRISQVTSHDKSTVESLLDRHIECLGLQPELDTTFDTSESNDVLAVSQPTSTDDTTIKLTDILARLPHAPRRPMTATSQQHSSLTTLDRKAMKPRRLFASMDARVPGTIEEKPSSALMSGPTRASLRPSFGWQTLPSTSQLRISSLGLPSLESGELGDTDTSATRSKLRVKRRSLMSVSPSEDSSLLALSLEVPRAEPSYGLRKRSKSDLVARQVSHRRRRIKIRLKLKTRSKTTGDLVSKESERSIGKQPLHRQSRPVLPSRISSMKSPVDGYAELSGDSVPVSQVNLHTQLSRSPPIPTRWSSIIAAMPLPVKRSVEIVRRPSARTQRSHRSNSSIVEPINTTRIHGQITRLGSVPQLAPPEFGPPLTTSELNLSIPYAAAPSTIRPTLRETKSFFSDNSSAHRQRKSLRQKLHLHSLRNMVPSSPGASLIPHTPRPHHRLKLSHSCQMKGREFVEIQDMPGGNTTPMTDLAYRKRKVLERLKGWWKRQCLQKVVAGRKRKGKSSPEGDTWPHRANGC